jgi:hypothetical protein
MWRNLEVQDAEKDVPQTNKLDLVLISSVV